MVLVILFSQHEPFIPLSVISPSSLLQIFTVVKKRNMVYVRTICGLGSSVSEEYTACVFSRLSEERCSKFIQNSIHTRFVVCVEGHNFNAFRFDRMS